jgi:hypothetical protein
MTHEVYLKHTHKFNIGICLPGYWGHLHEHNLADIMYCPEIRDTNANDDKKEAIKIGNIGWIIYKQELAIANGINMTQVPDLYIRSGRP